MRFLLLVGCLALEPSAIFSQDVREFKCLSRQGSPHDPLTASIDGVSRSFVEGGTLAAADWTVQLTDESQKQGLTIWVDAAPVVWAGYPFAMVRGSVTVRHPNNGAESRPIVFRSTAAPSKIIIPAMLSGTDRRGQSSNAIPLSDFIEDEKVSIVVRCIDRACYFGLTQASLLINSEPKAAAEEERSQVKFESKDPFENALQACESAWKEYESKMVTLGSATKKKSILLKDHNRIRSETDRLLREMDTTIRGESAKDLKQKAAIQFLLQRSNEAIGLIGASAKKDPKMQPWHRYFQAQKSSDEAELAEAIEHTLATLRMDPPDYVYRKCKRLYELVADMPLPKDVPTRALKEEATMSALPWTQVPPFLPELESLGRKWLPVRRREYLNQ